ncbi:TetR/AcrR family transcriptional regulator [Desulfovibrio inopinatus]|uniref:TetR/AcrR family transcriptional regulator n=1 Tax=Desulfovibrio inopinatus TaxID=102109 RepID=UPI0003FD2AFC|nr:TetR/AcrR family transcriptional regulator [Desulfovibrio inopinatus]
MIEKKATDIRQEEIIRATLAVAAEHGVSGITVKRVAEKVGLSPAALYRHFAGKDEVLSAVQDFLSDRIGPAIMEALSAKSPLAGVRSLFERIVAAINEHRMLPVVMISQDVWGEHPQNRKKMRQNFEMLHNGLTKLFEAARVAGEIRGDIDVTKLPLLFVGLYVPPALLSIRMPDLVDFQEQVQANWELFERAIVSETYRRP